MPGQGRRLEAVHSQSYGHHHGSERPHQHPFGLPQPRCEHYGGHQERAGLSFLKPSGFAFNGVAFSEEHRVFVRAKAGETLLYGAHRVNNPTTDASQRDPILTLRFGGGVCSRLWLTPTASRRCLPSVLFSLAEICSKLVLVKADSQESQSKYLYPFCGAGCSVSSNLGVGSRPSPLLS